MITLEQKELVVKEIERYKQKCKSLEFEKKKLNDERENDYRLQKIYERLIVVLKDECEGAHNKAVAELRKIKRRISDRDKKITDNENENADFQVIVKVLEQSVKE